MNSRPPLLLAAAALVAAAAAPAQPALTIYNQGFAVVRERVPLDLQAGENTVTFAGVTVHLEPDSVVLRDPAGKVPFHILEQSYRADTISAGLLLSLYEGKELDFLVRDQNAKEYTVRGKVIRSGYEPNPGGVRQFGANYYQQQMMQTQAVTPIIEVGGKLRFSLPGEPVFPALSDDALLKPLLTWKLGAERAAKFDAELSYLTGGMRWEASYNLVAPEKGDTLDLVGWVTLDNETGKTFEQAAIKLMAGDVNKVAPQALPALMDFGTLAGSRVAPTVTEKAFDEYHLYTLARPTTLHDRETKQVEFIRASGIQAKTYYVYNGAAIGPQYRGWNFEMIRGNRDYGTQSNPKVWVMREFDDSEANGLGEPLPAGKVRFYRRDDADGRLEFTGEDTIDHTPRHELVRLRTGDAFDLVGERRRTDYVLNNHENSMEEAFEIKVRNRKTGPVEVRVVERLYRWMNWQIVEQSDAWTKTDAQTAEFRVTVPPDGEKVVTYRVRYDWK